MQPIFARGNEQTRRTLLRWQQEAQSDKRPRLVLRLQAIRLSLQHSTAPEIARTLGVERTVVYDGICAWNQHHLEGLKEGHRSGRPAKLTTQQRERIFDIVDSGPVAYGFTTGVWTSPLLQPVIAEEFNVSYHPGHVRKLLKSLGCSVQRPTTHLVRADPVAQNKWVRYPYPNLKKRPAPKGR
jgi:transposase